MTLCLNHLIIVGLPEFLKDFESRVVGDAPRLFPADPDDELHSILNFHSAVPVPDGLLNPPQEKPAKAWMWEHWGCTGYRYDDVRLERPDGSLLYHFETYVMPPIPWVTAISAMFPTLQFTLDYFKCLTDHWGTFKAVNGIVHEAEEWAHDERDTGPAHAPR